MQPYQIENLNKGVSYPDGKIIVEYGSYTSKLIQTLYKNGWRVVISGCVHTLYDDKGSKVTTAYSWPGLLHNAAIIMR